MTNSELWRPSEARAVKTLLAAFMKYAGVGFENEVPDYDRLWDYSISDPIDFWQNIWVFCEVIGDHGDCLIDEGKSIKDTRFFPAARLNFAENLLRRQGTDLAIIFHGENGSRQSLSWDDLHAQVSLLQQALVREGVGKGDKVAGFLPNIPGAVIAMLATASLGAIWSSCSPDFGVNGVLDRFEQKNTEGTEIRCSVFSVYSVHSAVVKEAHFDRTRCCDKHEIEVGSVLPDCENGQKSNGGYLH